MAERKKGYLEDAVDRNLHGITKGGTSAAVSQLAGLLDKVYSPEQLNPKELKGVTWKQIIEGGRNSANERNAKLVGDRTDIAGMIGEQVPTLPLYLINPMGALASRYGLALKGGFLKNLANRAPHILDDILLGSAAGAAIDDSTMAREAVFGGGLSTLGNAYAASSPRARAIQRFAIASAPMHLVGSDAAERKTKKGEE